MADDWVDVPVKAASTPAPNDDWQDVPVKGKTADFSPKNDWVDLPSKIAAGGAQKLFPTLNEDTVKQTFGDRGLAAADSVAQGVAGVTPKYPELQAKYPVQSFGVQAAAGMIPYAVAGPGSLIPKFAGIGAAHEIISQATNPNETGNVFQRGGKVATSAITGGIMGKVFGSADLLKNIVQRASAVAAGGGITAGADRLSKDIIDGKEPDIHGALIDAGVSAATMGILKGVVEVPQLRSAVIQQASDIAGQPLDFQQSKKFLTTGKLFNDKGRLVSVTAPIDPESLAPALKSALSEAQRESVMKSAKEKADVYGVPKDVVLSVLRDQNVANRLATVDDQIYRKIKTATGSNPNFDWTTQDGDLSRLNPMARTQIQSLIDFRKQIASGMDPADALFRSQVQKQLKVKEYITKVLENDFANTKKKLSEYIDQNEQPQVVNPDEIVKASIDTVGTKDVESTQPAPAIPNEAAYWPHIQQALDALKQDGKISSSVTVENMDPIKRSLLVKDVHAKEMAGDTAGIDRMLKYQLDLSHPDRPDNEKDLHEFSVLGSHQGKEDSPDAVVYDWRNDSKIPINMLGLRLKEINYIRKQKSQPAITADNIIVHRRSVENQQGKGNEKRVKEAILREYHKAKLSPDFIRAVDSGSSETPSVPAEPTPTPIDQAAEQQAGDIAQRQEDDWHDVPVNEEQLDDKSKQLIASIPKAEKIHEQLRLHENRKVRKVVMDLTTTEDLARLAEKLDLTGTPEERLQKLSQASGLSIQDILILSKPSKKAAYHSLKALDADEKSDLETELNEVMNKLDDWYQGIDQLPLDQIIEDSDPERSFKVRDARQQPSYGSDQSVAFPKPKKSSRRQGNVKAIVDMKKGLAKHASFLGEFNLAEIHASLENKSDKVQGIIHSIIKDLKPTSDKNRVMYAIKEIKDAIRESQEEITNKKRKEAAQAGIDYLKDDEVDKDWHVFQKEDPDQEPVADGEYGFEQEDQPFNEATDVEVDKEGPDIEMSGLGSNLGNIRLKKRKLVVKLTAPERQAPIPIVLKFIMDNPWVGDLLSRFKTTQTKTKEAAQKLPLFKVVDPAQSALFDYVKYSEAIPAIVREDLQPILDYVLANVQDHMTKLGVKNPKSKETYQPVLDLYMSLMKKASSDIITKEYDPHRMSFSRLGYGPHESPAEVEAYVRSYKRYVKDFKLDPNFIPEGPQDILDAQGQPTGFSSVPGTLRHSRQAYAWRMLVDPKVMGNDSLRRAILFYKAQLEWPGLSNSMKLGMYSNADILNSILDGYAKNSWELDPNQMVKPGWFKGNGTAEPQRPEGEWRTPELFVEAGHKNGWVPVDDFLNDATDYLKEALTGIKQLQLARELRKVPLPRMEYTDPELEKLNLADLANKNSEHPRYTFHYVEHRTNPAIIAEAQRMSKLSGREITPLKVLTEGRWIQGKQDDGLNKWYRGSFEPPFIYSSLYHQIGTLLKARPTFDNLGKISQIIQTVKFAILSLPADSVSQYLGATSLERSAWKIIPYRMGLVPRSVGGMAKGLFKTGPSILTGTHSPVSRLKTDYEMGWGRKFLENGMVAAGGYKAFLKSMMDKVDPGKFPQRQDRFKDVGDYVWSVFGMGEEVMGQMVEQDILRAAIAIAENQVSRGKSVDEAAKFTAQYINNATWQLHKTAWTGGFGEFLRNITTSRNMAIKPFRDLMIMARIADLQTGSTLKKRGAFNFRTEGTGGKEWMNTYTAADTYERFMPELGWKMLEMFCKIWAASVLVKLTMQLAAGKNPFGNPEGAQQLIDTGLKDENGRELYLDSGWEKEQKNIMDILATAIDPIVHMFPGWENVHVGSGVVKFLESKLGVIRTLGEMWPGNADTYDQTEGLSWDNSMRFVNKFLDVLPLNPWVGSGQIKVPLSHEFQIPGTHISVMDQLMKSATLFGINFKPVESQEMQDMKEKVRHEQFKDKEIAKQIISSDDNKAALQDRKIDLKQYFNNEKKFSTMENEAYYRLHNKKNIFKK